MVSWAPLVPREKGEFHWACEVEASAMERCCCVGTEAEQHRSAGADWRVALRASVAAALVESDMMRDGGGGRKGGGVEGR